MVVALLRTKHHDVGVLEQQRMIAEYAQKHRLSVSRFQIDNSGLGASLEERGEVHDFLHSLTENETTLLVYDTLTLSAKVGELAKIFQCILKRSIELHICSRELIINQAVPNLLLLQILVEQREKLVQLGENKNKLGRPEGSISKSKFDTYQDEILELLTQNCSVSDISKKLGLSRSSLKDYINSRNLKAIARIKEEEHALEPRSMMLLERHCEILKNKENV